jgi:hypothetical protein
LRPDVLYNDDTFTSIRDMAICGSCGELQRADKMTYRTHRFGGANVTHLVCSERCAYEEPCPASFGGIHGEIEDLDDITEEQGVTIGGVDLPWWLFEIFIPKKYYGRLGRCVNCMHWMIWNVDKQAWRDPELLW